jgi:hypothetical protein
MKNHQLLSLLTFFLSGLLHWWRRSWDYVCPRVEVDLWGGGRWGHHGVCKGFLRQVLRPGLDQGTLFGAWHLCCKCSHKSGFVRYPYAFRLRRLTHSARLSFGPRFFAWEFLHFFLWAVHVHFDCARLRKVCVPILGPGFSPVNYRVKLLLWDVHVHFDCVGSQKVRVPILGSGFFAWEFSYKIALVRCTCPFQLRKLAQSVRQGFGHRFFPSKFSREITLVSCPY